MNGVQFQEEEPAQYVRQTTPDKGLAALIVKLGLVNNKRTANFFLTLLIIAFLALAFIIYPRNDDRDTSVPNDFEPGQSVFR